MPQTIVWRNSAGKATFVEGGGPSAFWRRGGMRKFGPQKKWSLWKAERNGREDVTWFSICSLLCLHILQPSSSAQLSRQLCMCISKATFSTFLSIIVPIVQSALFALYKCMTFLLKTICIYFLHPI